MVLPKPPIASITSVTYVDTDGATQTWSSALYQTDLPSGPTAEPARILPAYNESYPSTRAQMNAVTVRFVAGYGVDGSYVPEDIKLGMHMLIGHWYEQREAVVVGVGIGVLPVPINLDVLLGPYKVYL
jgi:uncharacterized phiE125 gp8 family phage protein